MKLLLTISYVGTHFHGYQCQPKLRTVQGTLQTALEGFFEQKLLLTGASRTDAGVHARMFCLTAEGDGIDFNFKNIPPEKIPLAMAPYLPPDLVILSAKEVDTDFHARYDVKYKEYCYEIDDCPIRSPFSHDRAWHHPTRLNVDIMNQAASHFIGKHDFSAFMAQGSPVATTVREIYYFDVSRTGDRVTVRVAADGFLYNMVRILAGTLVAVSDGKISPDAIPDIIESGNRTRAGSTLPPDGLYLNKVVY